VKFVLFPLVPSLPAFRLHQHIAYGGTFGEWLTFGPMAWFGALALWWASWAVALVLVAGALRAGVELAGAAVLAWRPERVLRARRALLALARLVYYVGVPGWLILRLLGD
jgi:apolipoprotein N-acyltransferase